MSYGGAVGGDASGESSGSQRPKKPSRKVTGPVAVLGETVVVKVMELPVVIVDTFWVRAVVVKVRLLPRFNSTFTWLYPGTVSRRSGKPSWLKSPVKMV